MPGCSGYAPGASGQDGRLTCETCLQAPLASPQVSTSSSSSTQCFWYASRASCSWRAESEFAPDPPPAATSCRAPERDAYRAPAKDWVYTCENGGILSDFETGFTGASCECPKSGLWTGRKCEICASNDACRASDGPKELEPPRHCARGVMPDPGETRKLSCDCTSELCSMIGFGVNLGKVQITATSRSKTSNAAIVDLIKSVPSPWGRENELGSPYLLRGYLEKCTGARMSCSQVCGNSKCPESVVWRPSETCLVYECAEGRMECPDPDATWAVHREECAPVRALFRAPFQFVCVDDPPNNEGSIRCGFATHLLSHGSLSLSCSSGACVDGPDKNETQLPVLRDWCPTQGSNGEACRELMYSAILLVPLMLVASLALVLRRLNRPFQSNAVEISSSGEYLRVAENGDVENHVGARPHAEKIVWLSFENVAYSYRDDAGKERRVLESLSGHLAGKEMCGLLGPSGSGKTSLLDILTGRKNTGSFTSDVRMSGESRASSMSASTRRRRLAVVLQDESLPSTSTVREYLLFHAVCRRDERATVKSIVQRVEDTIRTLKLESCADRVIGDARHGKSLSGGERRRASLGVELLDEERDVVVMDEPCTGLDSTNARAVVEALRALADSGKAVLISIHSPSLRLYNAFDRVAILAQCGTCVYMGKREDLLAFATRVCGVTWPESEVNPAEFVMDEWCYASESATKRVSELFESSAYRADQVRALRDLMESESLTSTTLLSAGRERVPHGSFLPLLTRSFRHAFRHPVLAATNVLATLATSALCGLLYRGVTNDLQGAINRAGLFFFLCAYLTLFSLADLGAWHDERVGFVRERATGSYDAGAYLAAKLLGEILPLRLVTLALASLILTWLVGLNPDPRAVLLMYGLLVVVSVTSTLEFLLVGSLVGSVLKSPRQADHACVSLACFNMLLSGFLLSFEGVKSDASSRTLSSIRFLSPIQFVFQSLMVNEISSLTFEIEIKAPKGESGDDDVVTRVSATGSLILANLGFDPTMLGTNVALSLVFMTLVGLLNYAALKWIATERR